MYLEYFIKLYKLVAHKLMDNVNSYESIDVNHIINYSVENGIKYKTHEFTINKDSIVEFYLSATTISDEFEKVLKWKIQCDYNHEFNYYTFDQNNDTCTKLELLNFINYLKMWRSYWESNPDSWIDNPES